MYKVMAKYNGAYAIMDTESTEIEALREEDLRVLLYFGVSIEGVSYNPDGSLNELVHIDEMTDDDVAEDDEDVYEPDDDYEEIDEDYDEDFEEDYEEEYEEEYEEDFEEDDEDFGEDLEEEDEYYDDDDYFEDDYEIEDRSTVQKLYDYLDAEQVKLIKRYYLWYSQRLFVNANKDPNLGMKDKNRIKAKQEALDQLRNTGGMWHYAGFIDMGYEGGYCTLGHPLRYMHVAWDVSQADLESSFFGDDYDFDVEEQLGSTNCIIFGIKCISDFFEVDSECTASLQRAQRESIKDMGIMYEQYANGTVKEVNDSFAVMDTLLRRVKIIDAKGIMFGQDYVPILKDGFIKFYEQFRNALMPVPKSLIQEIRDCLVDWDRHKFYKTIGYPGAKFGDTLVRLYPRLKPMKEELKFTNNVFYYTPSMSEMVYRFYRILYTYKSCGVFEYNADNNKDEGGSSEAVRGELHGLYASQKRNFFKDCEYTQEYAEKVASFVIDFYDISEKFKGLVSLFYTHTAIEDIDKFKKSFMESVDISKNEKEIDIISTLGMYVLRQDRVNLSMFCKDKSSIDAYLSEANACIDRIQSLLKFADDLKEKAKKDEISAEEQRERLDKLAEDDEKEYATLDEIFEYMKSHPEPKTGEREFKFAERIWRERVAANKPPVKGQIPYIEKLYTKLTGRDVRSAYDKLKLGDYPVYMTAVNYMLKNGSGFIRDVCVTVNSKGVFSPKQRIYLDEAVTLYNSQTGNMLKIPDIK